MYFLAAHVTAHNDLSSMLFHDAFAEREIQTGAILMDILVINLLAETIEKLIDHFLLDYQSLGPNINPDRVF